MTKKIFIFALLIILASLVAGCNALRAVAPLPEPTISPTPTTILYTPTPLPTLGTLEYLNAAYCFDDDPNPDDEYNLLRFFRSGVVLELKVQGKGSCQASWDYVSPYLIETATDTFNHGEYQLSGSQIQFTLAPANSDEVAGIVTGRYEGDKMLLQQQGVSMEYVLVYGG
ncbi:MAG: hypothetical protein ABIF04_03445, partial [Chloroflexota bacterium]